MHCFFFNDTATTEIYTLSLHDALPIYSTPPPPIESGSEYSQDGDARYAMLPPEVRPQTECLARSEEHTSELQSRQYLVCRLLLEKKKKILILHITNFSHLRPFYLSFTI